MEAEFSLWLLPAATHEAVLLETIACLSTLLGGPGFAPHVTIQGDIALPRERLHLPLARLAARMPVQSWRVERVENGEHFFRCLYLRFGDQSAFAAMQKTARALTRTADGLSPFPHLSLAYADPDPGNARLCETLVDDFAAQEMVFDRLAVCRSSKHVPVPEWECLAQYPLATALNQ